MMFCHDFSSGEKQDFVHISKDNEAVIKDLLILCGKPLFPFFVCRTDKTRDYKAVNTRL